GELESTLVPLTVDTVLVVTTGDPNSTHACMAGAADSDDGTITLGLDIGAGACPTFDMAAAGEGRWSGSLTISGGSLCASNYFCSVSQGDNTFWSLPIGVPGTVP